MVYVIMVYRTLLPVYLDGLDPVLDAEIDDKGMLCPSDVHQQRVVP